MSSDSPQVYSRILKGTVRNANHKGYETTTPCSPGCRIRSILEAPFGTLTCELRQTGGEGSNTASYCITVDGMDGRFFTLEGDLPEPVAALSEADQ